MSGIENGKSTAARVLGRLRVRRASETSLDQLTKTGETSLDQLTKTGKQEHQQPQQR